MNDFAPSTRRADSKRRIGLIKKVSRAPGQALSDFNIFKLVARYWAARKMVFISICVSDSESADRVISLVISPGFAITR